MATRTLIEPLNPTTNSNPHHRLPKPRRVCFSFAAYAKSVIDHLKASNNVAVEPGLTADEFAAVESAFHFTFPPDLRSILQEGLPVGPGFPNWRSSSAQQLEILTNLPILGLCKEVSRHHFWAHSWGEEPNEADEAVKLAKRFLKKSPVLVPIYRQYYIPATPNLAGNPVFYVNGGDVRLWSFDVAGFFQQVDFGLDSPAWAATEARWIEFWTETSGGTRRRWWSGDLELCMEGVCCRLRDGGWREDEVREMTMVDGGDGKGITVWRDRDSMVWHVRVLSVMLLRAGWSTEDVVDSLGCHVESDGGGGGGGDLESWLDFQHAQSCVLEAI